MGYRIVELQTDANGNTAILADPRDFAERNDAESKWHDICKYAAISTVAVHAVIILNSEGDKVRKDVYEHKTVGGEQ